MEMEGIDEVLQQYRFNPSPLEAVTYFLPRLISGEPMLHGVERLIHRADVYACEPKDLAAAFGPVPKCGNSGDRFFFTLCKRQKGRGKKNVRASGPGSWVSQSTRDIEDDAGVKVGESKKLRFILKDKVKTEWLMDEYRCLRQEAVVDDGDLVMCKIHVSPRAVADSGALQFSARKVLQQESEPAPCPEPVSKQAFKRPAPVSAADPPCPKRTRVAVSTPPLVQQGYYAVFAPPPALTETPGAADEADGDMDRFTCSLDELLGAPAEEETLPADNKEPELLPPFTSDELKEFFDMDEFPENFPLVHDPEELNDLGHIAASLDDILGGAEDEQEKLPTNHGEEPEQQAVFSRDESAMGAEDELKELLGRYRRVDSRSIFRLDQLEGHKEFFSI